MRKPLDWQNASLLMCCRPLLSSQCVVVRFGVWVGWVVGSALATAATGTSGIARLCDRVCGRKIRVLSAARRNFSATPRTVLSWASDAKPANSWGFLSFAVSTVVGANAIRALTCVTQSQSGAVHLLLASWAAE